ncbi:MAG: DUF917 domain-containing protein [Candidatus Nephthysia bennettiae]|uniref:DUF917 domain-containing protein n=1 Tax=Candidatus Nephthysia bennettiae TaxID=3127016 RepID=A0A934K1J4_9BACT|nr:DUF917 domain-containing protein [Candidatus Dormibacteraeota bacterium]MBJ7613569.1 DUF917 domain-containing protein [Candidatus Dormibacteraeota bacterium]PZR87383.1 MAG: DUF917 domain-containing protein [Candidatus Dormibacteraeota bacterium]
MRRLGEQQIRDVARGAAVLGTGGGGDPYLGTLAAVGALQDYGAPQVMEIDELSDDVYVASLAMVGAPVPLVEKFALGPELLDVYRALDEHLDEPIHAFVPVEIGGVNTVIALILAARLGLPVVDADYMGRAYPEVQLVTPTLYGRSASPFALADEHGNRVLIDAKDNVWAERIGRTVAIEFGAIAPGMMYPMTGRHAKEAAVVGTLSYAERIGRTLREAEEQKRDALQALLEVTGGFTLFRGKIVDIDRRTQRGWSLGEVVLEGMDAFRGSRMNVRFQNENLVAFLDDRLVASVPDLITIIDEQTGQAVTTERLHYGFRVIVLGIRCDAKWRSPAGVALGGPRHFGYDIDYVPLEELNQAGFDPPAGLS